MKLILINYFTKKEIDSYDFYYLEFPNDTIPQSGNLLTIEKKTYKIMKVEYKEKFPIINGFRKFDVVYYVVKQ